MTRSARPCPAVGLCQSIKYLLNINTKKKSPTFTGRGLGTVEAIPPRIGDMGLIPLDKHTGLSLALPIIAAAIDFVKPLCHP